MRMRIPLAVVALATFTVTAGCRDQPLSPTPSDASRIVASESAVAQQNWPEAIAMPTGWEGEGIELGKGHEFFVGANSFSSLFGPYPVSWLAGAIYKGNLRTGVGDYLVAPTGKSASGLGRPARSGSIFQSVGRFSCCAH